MEQKVKLGRDTRMPKRLPTFLTQMWPVHYVSGTGQETSQQADLASNMKLAGGFGMGAGILSNSGGAGLPLGVGEG